MICKVPHCGKDAKYVQVELCPACFEWRRRVEMMRPKEVGKKYKRALLLGARWAVFFGDNPMERRDG